MRTSSYNHSEAALVNRTQQILTRFTKKTEQRKRRSVSHSHYRKKALAMLKRIGLK